MTEAGTRHSLFDEQKELDKDLSALRDSIKRHSKLDFNKVGNDRPTNDPLAKRPNSSVNLTTFLSSPSSESHTNRPSPRPGHHSPSTEELSQIFPVDIVALASKIQGLAEILQPYRKLMFKFNAIVDLEQEREVSTNFMNGIFRRIRPKDIKPTVLPTKCLIILFNDILCICTAQKLKAALPIVETWIDTEILPKLCERGLYPFHISTPEKLFLCYLDEESKLHLLNRIWESTLKARLVQGLFSSSLPFFLPSTSSFSSSLTLFPLFPLPLSLFFHSSFYLPLPSFLTPPSLSFPFLFFF